MINGETQGTARISDLYGIIPAITGKVELVYEGELEGISNVAYTLIGKAIRSEFIKFFPDPERTKKSKQKNPYSDVIGWFGEGNEVDILHNGTQNEFDEVLKKVTGLHDLVKNYFKNVPKNEISLMSEFLLHGLSEYSQISKRKLESTLKFSDLVGSIFNMKTEDEE